jgi:hypothetical protein
MNMPIERGIHRYADGSGYMCCTADRYALADARAVQAGLTEEIAALDVAIRHMRSEAERYEQQKLYKSAAQYLQWTATLRSLLARLSERVGT